VIGEEAHLGARLEAANKDFHTRILISEATWLAVAGELAARELDLVRFRGIERPVRVFELLGEEPLPAALAARVQEFKAALASYRAGEISAALARFEALHAEAPEDYPAEIYLGRCREQLAATASIPRAQGPICGHRSAP
jgi:adenylate cyclase